MTQSAKLKIIFISAVFQLQLFFTSGEEFVQSESYVLKFTYGDNDKLGPRNWPHLDDGLDLTNACDDNWRSPININTTLTTVHERKLSEQDLIEEQAESKFVESLLFNFKDGLETVAWEFGYPTGYFHGVVIRPPHYGTFQLIDKFDQITQQQKNVLFDFGFATVHYCDLEAHPNRSMHSINGKKFPLEIDFFFLKEEMKVGLDTFLHYNTIVTVAVQGTVDKKMKDNPRIQPLIEAAIDFRGPAEFDLDTIDSEDTDLIGELIVGPWSPSWLLPEMSSYYYYNDASFPVAPCFKVARVYVLKEKIKISQKQFDVLTNIKSGRELTGKLDCTFSIQQTESNEDIQVNNKPYRFRGDDKRPVSAEEFKKLKERYTVVDSKDRVKDSNKSPTLSQTISVLFIAAGIAYYTAV